MELNLNVSQGSEVKDTVDEQKPRQEELERMIRMMDEKGMAKVKLQYLKIDHKPRLDTTYLPEGTYKDLEQQLERSMDSGQPSKKKLKLTGRNKKRPHEKRQDPSLVLCPAVIREEPCPYAEKCKFSHDVKKFIEEKPEDLGSSCHVFETFGKCHFGLRCRYGNQHISEDFTNIVNKDLYEKTSSHKTICNQISKDLQLTLRKRKYKFEKADKAYKFVMKNFSANKTTATGNNYSIENDKVPQKSFSEDIAEINNEEQNTIENNSKESPEKSVAEKPHDNVSDFKNMLSLSQPEVCDKEKDNQATNSKLLNAYTNSDIEGLHQNVQACPDTNNEANDLLHTSVKSEVPTDVGEIRLRPQEKRKINFSNKLYLAPLTTVGNLPFRRICKTYGADITCGEMAMATNLLQGQASEWALIKRHESEKLFGVQLCGAYPDSMTRCAQLLTEQANIDFIDINVGCPIDLVFHKGEGCALMGKMTRFEQIVRSMTSVMDIPLTVKMRTGIFEHKHLAHNLIPKLKDWGASLMTLHGRSREQRYTKLADWNYIQECASLAHPIPLYGNGDILCYEDANVHLEQHGVSGIMVARGGLIKPWIFTEIKEQRHWDISSGERFDMMKDFVNFGLEHWGSDQQGVETTRKFLLEWQSFLYRYIPVGILDRIPQKVNERPPFYFGRNDLETLMASPNCADWIKLSQMLLGPVPQGFTFLPKHKANAYK